MLQGGGILFSLLGMGLAIGLYAYPDNGKNRNFVFPIGNGSRHRTVRLS